MIEKKNYFTMYQMYKQEAYPGPVTAKRAQRAPYRKKKKTYKTSFLPRGREQLRFCITMIQPRYFHQPEAIRALGRYTASRNCPISPIECNTRPVSHLAGLHAIPQPGRTCPLLKVTLDSKRNCPFCCLTTRDDWKNCTYS